MKTNKLVVGLLAHVDAGKTTLAENILYACGAIGKRGRVDHQDTFLDSHSLERERGITIFSKQAFFSLKEFGITLLDTPGHVDFGSEMERTLQVLDYAILVINGSDGIQSHTLTLWNLLKNYQIPAFLFVNKMDRGENREAELFLQLQRRFGEECLNFTHIEDEGEAFYEELALRDEGLLEEYLEGIRPSAHTIGQLIQKRKLFPVYFGSALKDFGVSELLEGMASYFLPREYPDAFGARVFKISRDGGGNRLTHLKITGGSLRVKQLLEGTDKKSELKWQDKADQIRLYSGDTYTLTGQVSAGDICALTGLTKTYAGEGLGGEKEEIVPYLEPVLTYSLIPEPGINFFQAMEKLETLCQEDPALDLRWKEGESKIQVKVMGEIQLEVLKRLIMDRFQMKVEFGQGNISYKETIAQTVEGVGHFEPLRHYAEVHLLLEPLPQGSGLVFCSDCSEDILDRNWQNLILTHLREKQHLGVLTGAPITDMKITLLTGKAHPKHTEGGDFRQATYRAVRQGLRKAESILLEPVYEFLLEIPQNQVGRAMSDIQRMHGLAKIAWEEEAGETGWYTDGNTRETEKGEKSDKKPVTLTGRCPVATMRDYHLQVISYTQGKGRLSCRLKGYEPCHNTEEVVGMTAYQPQADMDNPCGSIFCSHGAGVYVEWDQVEELMHLEAAYHPPGMEDEKAGEGMQAAQNERSWEIIDWEEIDSILNRTFHANRKEDVKKGRQGFKKSRKKEVIPSSERNYKPPKYREAYLLVDGYNVIFAWEDLRELARVSLDGARGKLMDILCNYQAMKGCQVICVFDAYRLQGHKVEILDYHNIHVVYTREAETADQYIEKFAHDHGKEYQITVATSDGLEQVIIRGQGCALLSARDLAEEMIRTKEIFMEKYGTGL